MTPTEPKPATDQTEPLDRYAAPQFVLLGEISELTKGAVGPVTDNTLLGSM